MPEPATTYAYQRGERGIFAEIYFPRRVAAQGTIFKALQEGYSEDIVKTYLEHNVEALLEELRDYRQIFDPHQYDAERRRRAQLSVANALARIAMYASPFKGWSNYRSHIMKPH